MCLLKHSADGYWYYAKDSERADMDLGMGRGVRGFTRDALRDFGFDFLVVEQVQTGGVVTPPIVPPIVITPPTGPNAMTIASIKTLAAALVDPVTQAQKAQGLALFNALVVAPVTPPVITPPIVPPTAAVTMPPALSLTDAAGYVWTQGAFVSDRFGSHLLCNGRGLATTKLSALVNGKVRYDDQGTWREFSGDPYAPVWSVAAAP
jgi:hypothetical protein